MAGHGAFATLFDSVAACCCPPFAVGLEPNHGLDGGCAPPSPGMYSTYLAQGCSGAGSQRNRGGESTTTVGVEAGEHRGEGSWDEALPFAQPCCLRFPPQDAPGPRNAHASTHVPASGQRRKPPGRWGWGCGGGKKEQHAQDE